MRYMVLPLCQTEVEDANGNVTGTAVYVDNPIALIKHDVDLSAFKNAGYMIIDTVEKELVHMASVEIKGC